MVEQVLNKMKEILEAHLLVELGKQDGHAGDGITCDPIASYIIGDETPPNTGLPAIVLRAEGMSVEHWATGKKDVNYNISIGVAVTDTDEDRSQRKLWRTMRAVESALEINAPGNSPIIEYKTIGMDFHASLFEIDDGRSTEKGGIIQSQVMERLDSYSTAQV